MSYRLDQGISPTESYSGQGDAASFKNRSRRPCDSCRRRKSRCELVDGATPCVLCRFHRQECTFKEDPQPRKRKAASLSEEETNNTNSSRDSLRRPPQVSSDKGWIPRHSFLDVAHRPSHQIRQDPPIDDYANLKGPSLLKKTLGLQNHRHSRFIGSTSEYEQTLLELDAYNDKDEVPIGVSALRKVNATDAFILTPDEGTRNHEDEIVDLDAIEMIVAPHGQALIHLYFRIVHPSFPILHKKVFLEKYQRTHREFSPPLLAAVYILALNWWSYSSDLALLPKPDVPKLEKLAFKTVNDIIHRPKLSTIQAGLLLLQRPEGDSWALTSQLVGLGQDLGLHLDCSNWRVPAWERGLRKRLAWALFMQDKWGSLVHGRPSHIATTDWEVQPLSESDFPESAADEDDEDGSTEVEKGRTLFCEMITLTEILAVILSNFYTLKAEQDIRMHAQDGVRWILEKAKPSQLALKTWFAQMPAILKMENVAMRKLSSTGYLHLGYYAVEITLHRRIIRSLSLLDDPSLISICRNAARARLVSAMDFVQGLRPEHLQSFWYSASKYCFALIGSFVSLLWVTAQEKEEAEFYKAKLEEYRWTLRLSSKSADFLERAISMLAISTGVLVKAIPDKSNAEFAAARMRNPTKPQAMSTRAHAFPDSRSHTQSAPTNEYSESESYEGQTTEHTPDIGETPEHSATNEDFIPDHLWFANAAQLNDISAVYGESSAAGMDHDFMSMPGIGQVGDGYDFQAFGGHERPSGSGDVE
ncbi:uncharacterized protein BDZ99DRAFT_526192 [Mytilinidion resinicola]|uniref:Zn(2)-C6 fungal-type domain-containing protein n=1 Tax=Mytilinidion resinicola TaxID=574789 RepID=A0A6A6Y686_9PEZI|nr:uncharacterized protein BDZ99DRAFT_526192 [Mytilinidion resinicola]KAF2803715.1 hypothetical protein BDZ99DRAFT_526192 [Mytilinidion resinicola]